MNTDPGCRYQNRLFYKLKNYPVVQSILINTLLARYNYKIDVLNLIPNIDENKFIRVWKKQEQLSEKEASDLVCLFYGLLDTANA